MTKQNCINLVPEYPGSFDNFYGYGARAYNGFQEKSFTYTINTAYEFGRFASISSPAQNDTYEVNFPLKAGTYTLILIHDRGTSRGIASIYFDDAFLGNVDCYAAATAAVNRTTYTVNVSTPGIHNIKIRILNKNSSSTGFVFNSSGLFLAPVATQTTVRINCGSTSNYKDSLGQDWLSDAYFTGGSAWDIEFYIGAFTVANTSDQYLYKFERSLDSGSFNYIIPVASGTYNLRLHFSENNKSGTGQRVGTIALNGSNLLSNFDIFSEAGGGKRALIKNFNSLSLTAFNLTVTNTLINAVELIRVV